MYAIVTPTYDGHFKYIPKYLESFCKYVVDPENIKIYFVVEKKSCLAFEKIIDKYKKHANICVLVFEELLEKNDVTCAVEELMDRYGRYSYQTLKKLYALQEIDEQYSLILDSESMWINKTHMQSLFEEYIHNPFVSFSSISKRLSRPEILIQLQNNVSLLFNCRFDIWTLENFMWFVDKRILKQLFDQIGSPFHCVDFIRTQSKNELGLMEALLYQNYLYLYSEQFHYKRLDINFELEKYLGVDCATQYLKHHDERFHGEAGTLEHVVLLLNPSNTIKLAKLVRNNHIRIIRCEYSGVKNYILQSLFMLFARPNILAASQDHLFGLNKINRRSVLINGIKRGIKRWLKIRS